MKKLSLDKTWSECLEMWKWIAGKIKENPVSNIEALKKEWLEKNGYDYYGVCCGCFFCAYDERHEDRGDVDCCYCPAILVNPALKSYFCEQEEPSYDNDPIGFYKKLVALNKIRLSRKHKTKKRKK